MSDESTMRSGQVSTTPEGGPVDAGVPDSAPGAGQVQATPEGGPADEGSAPVPPSWREQMRGPIPGLDDQPAQAASAAPGAPNQAPWAEPPQPITRPQGFPPQDTTAWGGGAALPRSERGDEELKKWPPYSGKPVSDISEALRYAAPVVSQAEKLAIRALDLSGRGLTKLAGFLEERRADRERRGDDRG